ncbi:uncharacterized protein SPPG_01693 [Spizellomyces punctatus DAOM BR117]|uniref:Enoyl-CoA hydratase/isomerase n=1 Tax=Spizellomyces punctatus (strain DAOM BR117) TaxID=645134 RepID=A0A0L0HNJ2_SPIPD|nr:uncharacterized protein SPPG_01693 [Spizellomyces punctatus DAOM BR117]KND02608.1 hypothetical protein SPPG_01693 [Spizellomyces punctatus DAOM BR117]|eukprot:XP_016610647.1 hypothetical protein SPPG_01693 [Spizellomyces punctatus DAOM BR117]
MSAPYQQILYSVNDGVATITLNYPERANAISSTMSKEIPDAFARANEDPVVRVIVLTGTGKYFCTGMDLGGSSTAQNGRSSSPQVEAGYRFFESIANSPKPVIARVNGPCLGGGVGVLFCCDIRVSVASAYISFPEVRRGLVPAIISLYITPQLGPFRTRQYMLTGEKVTAKECLRIGALSEVVDDEVALDTCTRKYSDLLIEGAPGALTNVKHLVRLVSESPAHEDAIPHVKEVFTKMLQSEEARDGMSAFLKKTKPSWSKQRPSKL